MKAICHLFVALTVVELTSCSSHPDINPKAPAAEIRALIDQLAVPDNVADLSKAEFNTSHERFSKAFAQLVSLAEDAFPYLVEHLDDKRRSLYVRNHYRTDYVKDACYWIMYEQLQDLPEGYSSYGYQRKGRDGKLHVKPYWASTPFDKAGGLAQWLEEHKTLSFIDKKMKCLEWLLSEEKAIGAPDADSYFRDILPLEIRILEKRLENGEDIADELDRLRDIHKRRLIEAIPTDLLPEHAPEAQPKERR